MNCPSSIALLVTWSDEFRNAPEFQALHRWVHNEVEQVWEVVSDLKDLDAWDGSMPLLVVDERCLVGRRSLTAMREALDAGAPAVAPWRLGHTGLSGLETIRSLRGIQWAEDRVLGSQWKGPATSAPPFAALLLPPEAAASNPGLSARDILATEPAQGPAVGAGMCHQFIDYYGEPREDILPFIDPAAQDILEIGCGRGVTGTLLQERLGCRVTGVEMNPVVARAAGQCLHRVCVGDILEIDPGGPYDAVVACELFEHLTEQELFLRRLRKWVHPGGQVILSVPNVGHYSIVEDLMAGRWDYMPIGLVCYTHFRFFTHKTLEDWLEAAGYRNFRIIPQKSEEPPWIDAVPEGFEIDRESLSTHGFYVVIDIEG